MNLRTIILALALLSFLSTSIGGYLYYSSLKKSSLLNAHKEAAELTINIADDIDFYLAEHQKSVKVLAGLDEIQHALLSRNSDTLLKANSILDHFQKAMAVSVCYLMDNNGITIASSNRNSPVSFMGKNYAFRPYFQRAVHGDPYIYMALGVTSKKRGIYYSYPVYGKKQDNPLGVVVIKASINNIQKEFEQDFDGAMLLSDIHGVVFVSNRKDWLYHTLWEASSGEISDIAGSRQFGNGPWPWTGVEIKDGQAYDNSGNEYSLHRASINSSPDWNIIYLHDYKAILKRVAVPLFKTAGSIILILCLLIGTFVAILYKKASHDIIRRKKTEELLYQSKNDWEDTFNTITDMITIHDKDFNIIRSNRAAKKILNIPLMKDLKAKCFTCYHSTDSPPESCPSCSCLKTGTHADFEIFEPHLNSLLELRTIPRFDSNNRITGLINIVRDISKRKLLEEELLRARKLESVGILAGGIAHDFNNLLQEILGNISFAKMISNPEGKVHKILEDAESGYKRAISLTNKLITFSKGGDPVKKPVSIKKIIMNTTHYTLKGSEIKITLEIPDTLWPVDADERQISRAIQNILLNSIDAVTEKGTVTVIAENTTISANEIAILKEGRYIKISIKDNGPGINQENLLKIFDPYFSTKEMGNEKGMGLGLTLCYSIIEKHGGLITVESEVNAGTVLHIYLPVSDKKQKKDKKPKLKTVA